MVKNLVVGKNTNMEKIILEHAYLLINFENGQIDELECPIKIAYPSELAGSACISGYQNNKLVEYIIPHNRYFLEIRHINPEEEKEAKEKEKEK